MSTYRHIADNRKAAPTMRDVAAFALRAGEGRDSID